MFIHDHGKGRGLALWWHKQISFFNKVQQFSPVVLLKIMICFYLRFFINLYIYVNIIILCIILCIPPCLVSARGELKLLPIFPKMGLDRMSTLRGSCWKGGGNFFQGVTILTKKIKSEIFNDNKKVYKQKYFSLS